LALDTGGTAYSWYEESIPLDWEWGLQDGFMPDGSPYLKFQGTDASPQGHCLEIALVPICSVDYDPNCNMPSLVTVSTYDHGTNKIVTQTDLTIYSVFRMWLNHNSGPSGSALNWALYLAAPDSGATSIPTLAIKRLEINKAQCTTSSGFLRWISFEGWDSGYTFTQNP